MYKFYVNSIALRKAKIVYNFGLSECNRVKFFYVMDKVLSGKLCCMRTNLVEPVRFQLVPNDLIFSTTGQEYFSPKLFDSFYCSLLSQPRP